MSKEAICSAGNTGDLRDMCSIPASGRTPGGGHGDALQYSCLENPTDRGAWQVIVYRVTKSQTRLKQQSMHAFSQEFSYMDRFKVKIAFNSYCFIMPLENFESVQLVKNVSGSLLLSREN